MRSGWKRFRRAGTRQFDWISSAAASVLLIAAAWASGVQGAAATGETRSLTFRHTHTNETATVTFRRDGQYDEEGLDQLNWLLRDWRVDAPVKMDPRLFDILWEVYREAGSSEPIHVISAYRSPSTNGMLRQRSRAVSEHSQHMSGKAIDVRLPDVDPARLRAIAMRLQHGGVGYYAASNFVHIDTGSVRAWPRMSLEQLARLFPDGKTVHLPPSGKPLPGYEQARAEIAARNESAGRAVYAGASGPSLLGFLGKIFGTSAETGQSPPPVAPVETAAADPSQVAVPLPPRRPQAEPVQVAGGARPLANLKQLPAPERSEMDWPSPDDREAVIRSLFTATQRGRSTPEVPRIVLVQAEPRVLETPHALPRLEPATSLAATFSTPRNDLEPLRFTYRADTPSISVREANAGQ
jgi:uncharacterized protein YcbK (DUF882 family)